MTGSVILVGAGPGDPGLLTEKGRSALQNAEVVVFDRLVSPAILSLIPAKAERIDVGKQASHHLVPQEEINRILLRKALEGKRVVRLKGGDLLPQGKAAVRGAILQSRGACCGQNLVRGGTHGLHRKHLRRRHSARKGNDVRSGSQLQRLPNHGGVHQLRALCKSNIHQDPPFPHFPGPRHPASREINTEQGCS